MLINFPRKRRFVSAPRHLLDAVTREAQAIAALAGEWPVAVATYSTEELPPDLGVLKEPFPNELFKGPEDVTRYIQAVRIEPCAEPGPLRFELPSRPGHWYSLDDLRQMYEPQPA